MAVKVSTAAPDVAMTPAAHAARCRFDWPAYGVLAAISAVGAGFAAWAYPVWDDGLWHMFYHLGSDRPAESVGTDRPLFCWLVKWIYNTPGLFWFETIGLSILTTWGVGLFTLYLAKRVLPRGQALATACLATAPLLGRAQAVLITYPLLLASIVGGFATIYLFETALRSGRTRGERYWRWAVGTVVFVIAGLLTEYTVAVAAAGMVWIVFATWPDGGARRRDGFVAALALGILTVAVYAVYSHFSDAAARIDATPEVSLTRNLRRLHVILPILVSSVYRGCLADPLRRLVTVGVDSYLDAGCVAAALLVAGLVGWLNRNASPISADEDRPRPALIVGLVLAVAAGLAPMALMNRWPTAGAGPVESRFWAPVVPFAVCVFSALANRVLRRRWLRYWPVFCAFLATWALASDEATLWRQRRAVSAIGAELRLHMPQSGFCVAVFEDSWLHQVDWLSDLGTTAIMTLDWPVDEARRFWAEPNLDRARPHGVSRYDRGEPLPNGKFRRAGQTFLREGKIARFLWVRTPVIGQLEIWSTDVTDDGAGAKPE